MPWLQRVAQRQLDTSRLDAAHERESELQMRREPGGVKAVASRAHLGQHILEVHADEGGQQEAVVQAGTPAAGSCPVRLFPEPHYQCAQQQLLHDAHACVGWHLEGTQFQQAQAAGGRVRRVHLVDGELAAMGVAGYVDQDVAQCAVHQPGWHVLAVFFAVLVDLPKRDFQLIQLVIAGLVNTWRLAGRADKHAAEQVTQARVVVPVQQQAGQQLRTTQERAVRRCGTAQHKVVAAAGTGVAAVGHEFFSRQTALERCPVQELGVVHQLAPAVDRVHVDFDHARVGCDLQQLEAWIAWRRVTLQHQPHGLLARCGFDRRQQIEVIVQPLQRRHEDVQDTGGAADRLGLGAAGATRITHLHTQRGAAHPVR